MKWLNLTKESWILNPNENQWYITDKLRSKNPIPPLAEIVISVTNDIITIQELSNYESPKPVFAVLVYNNTFGMVSHTYDIGQNKRLLILHNESFLEIPFNKSKLYVNVKHDATTVAQ